MYEYVKKALIAALLVVSPAFVPCLSNVTDFPDRTSELAHAAASPLFWQLWDELLSRGLAQWTKTVSDDDQQSEWPPRISQGPHVPFLLGFIKKNPTSQPRTPKRESEHCPA